MSHYDEQRERNLREIEFRKNRPAKCITEAKSKTMIDKMNASREIENRKIDGNMSNDDFRDLWGEL